MTRTIARYVSMFLPITSAILNSFQCEVNAAKFDFQTTVIVSGGRSNTDHSLSRIYSTPDAADVSALPDRQ
jgi:hypothetical protein